MRYLIVFLLFATWAGAVPVNPYSPDGIAARDGLTVLCVMGEMWSFDTGQRQWTIGLGLTGSNPPMPVTEIAEWGKSWLKTNDGTYWYLHPTGGDPQRLNSPDGVMTRQIVLLK